MVQLFFQMEGVMVNIFLLVSVLLDHTRLINSRDLKCTMGIELENPSLLMKLRHGSDRGAMGDNNKAFFSSAI